jgi:hypothetical protein
MIRNFSIQKTEHLIKKLEFLPETKLLVDDISITMQNEEYARIKIIKKIINYLKRLI